MLQSLYIWSHVCRFKSVNMQFDCSYLSLTSFSPCRYSASKYLSVALISAGIFICTIMSARQMVSPLQNMLHYVFICLLSVFCVCLSTHQLLQFKTKFLSKCAKLTCDILFMHLFLQNVGNEGSEEQGFYALMHWLIGEFRVPKTLNWHFIWKRAATNAYRSFFDKSVN